MFTDHLNCSFQKCLFMKFAFFSGWVSIFHMNLYDYFSILVLLNIFAFTILAISPSEFNFFQLFFFLLFRTLNFNGV